MAKKYLDYDGLLYFWQKIKANFVTDVTYNSTSKKIQKTKAGSTSDVVTLSTVATSGSYDDLSNKPSIPSVPNNFGTVKVGTTNVVADAKSDTLELAAGTNITLTPDATNDKVTIAFNGTIPSAGTGSDYPKMDGTKSLGSNAGFARVDHVHPSDTSRVPTTRTVNGKALSADVNLDGADITYMGTHSTDLDAAYVSAAIDTLYESMPADATTTQSGLMSAADKTKLNGIAAGAEVNQNAFSNVKVGSTTVAADGKTDTLELVAGSNVTLTPDATNDKVTIAATNTTYSDFTPATSSAAGTHGLVPAPSAGMTATTVLTAQGFKQTSLEWGTKSGVADMYLSLQFGEGTGAVSKAVKIPTATTAAHGLMSSSDKSKLNSLIITNGVIDASNLPSYVDDVIEAYARSGQTALSQNWLATGSASGTVITPEAGKIYVLMADSGDYAANTQFRWGGTAYVKLSDGGASSITNGEIDTIVAS